MQVNSSVGSSNAPSSGVQAVHVPEVPSIWNSTRAILLSASVAVPEKVGVGSVVESESKEARLMPGASVSWMYLERKIS